MPRYFVVENSPAVAFVRKQYRPGHPVWVTTSPGLISTLTGEGDEVYCPETLEPDQEADAIGMAGYDLAEKFCHHLDSECSWHGDVNLTEMFANTLGQTFYITFYKGLLLSRALEKSKAAGETLVCVGDPERVEDPGLSLHYGRFGTLFAHIAARAKLPGLEILVHTLPAEEALVRQRAVTTRRPRVLERLLLQINAGPSAVLFKFWNSLRSKGLFPFPCVRLMPISGRPVVVFRECELIEESFLGFLMRGARVFRLSGLPVAVEKNFIPFTLPNHEELRKEFCDAATKELEAKTVPSRPLYRACAEVLADRLVLALNGVYTGQKILKKAFDAILDGLPQGAVIVTNTLWTPEERYFYQRCRERGVPLVSFEHGITKGLSEWSARVVRFDGMHSADVGIYHNALSVEAMREHNPSQVMFVAGVAPSTGRPRLKPLQRALARKLLGVRPREQVVMFVTDAESNNFVFGPFGQNDRQFVHQTRAVASDLARALPGWRVVVKLYPTSRYYDSCDFSGLAREHSNILLVKDVEFRAVRAAADLIAVVSTQSTLGWALGAGVPVLLYDFEWWPGRVEGLEFAVPRIAGLRRVVLVNPEPLMTPFRPGFLRQVLSFGVTSGMEAV